MDSETKRIYESFYEIKWFENCGHCEDEKYSIVKDLSQAKRFYSGLEFDNIKNAIMNKRRHILWKITPRDLIDEQNRIADEIISKVDEFIENNKSLIFKNLPEDKYLIRHLTFDLRGILTEVSKIDRVQPFIFYPTLYPIYKAGFLPCGWDGKTIKETVWEGTTTEDLPEGKVRVY